MNQRRNGPSTGSGVLHGAVATVSRCMISKRYRFLWRLFTHRRGGTRGKAGRAEGNDDAHLGEHPVAVGICQCAPVVHKDA